MVRTEHDIVSQVRSAKTDSEAADALIRQYMGFIRSETVKFLHTAPENGHEDELSIAMLAFYEAVLAYEKSRGAFLPYAARAIKNRLIDHYRTEKRHGNVISLHTPLGGEEDGGELLDTIPDTVDHAGDYAVRTASRREIQEFSEKLAQFGLTFSDVADNCPGRSGPSPPAAGCWTSPGPSRSCSSGWRTRASCPWGSCPPAPAPTRRPWSGTGSTWWPSCWPSPTAMRSSGATCAR